MALTGRQFTITAGAHAATIAEVGAGLRRYAVGDVDVTGTYPADQLPPKGCGIMLVPWPNRVRGGKYTFDGVEQQLALTEPAAGNAIHGFGRWARWSPIDEQPHRLTLGLDVVPQTGYPHEIRAEITYTLDEASGLAVTLNARNTGATRAPFGAGSHPYLSTRGHPLADVTLTVPARSMLEVDAAQIPVGARPADPALLTGLVLGGTRFDDGFTDLDVADGRGVAEVRTPSGGARLWFDDVFRYLQVFTRENLTPGQHGVAIEPMTCAPDAFNSGDGLLVLEPGESWSGRWGITPS